MNTDNPDRIFYTLQNASLAVDLSIATLRRLEKSGKLQFFRIAGRTLVRAESLHNLIYNANETEPRRTPNPPLAKVVLNGSQEGGG